MRRTPRQKRRHTLQRSLENPATPLSDPAHWLVDAFGGGVSTSGVVVNRRTALTYSAVWRGFTLLTSTIAKLPLFVLRRLDSEGKERATDHPAYRILRRQPMPNVTPFVWKQVMAHHVIMLGNAYSWVDRDGTGRPLNMVPLSPEDTFPAKVNGKLEYVTRFDDRDFRLQPADVIHWKGMGYDGLIGYSMIDMAKESLGLGLAAQRYGSTFFRNNARASVVITHPGNITHEQKQILKDSWDKMHAGIDNAHRTAVLDSGMGLQQLSINAKDSQLNELREHEIRAVANWLGVPPHKLGDPTRTAFASLEAENRSFLDESLDPWLVSLEEELSAKLLTDRERQSDSHFIEFLREALLRADSKTETDNLVTQVNNGILSLDEARAIKNRLPLPGGLGAGFRMPANLTILTNDAEEDDSDDASVVDVDDEADRAVQRCATAAHRALLVTVFDRLIMRIRLRAVKRAGGDAEAFKSWLATKLEQDDHELAFDMLSPVTDAVRSLVGGAGPDAREMVAELYSRCGESLLVVVIGNPKDLKAAVSRKLDALRKTLPDSLAEQMVPRETGYTIEVQQDED